MNMEMSRDVAHNTLQFKGAVRTSRMLLCLISVCPWKTELAAAARYKWSKPLQAYTLEPAELASMAGVEARNCSATLPGKFPDSLA